MGLLNGNINNNDIKTLLEDDPIGRKENLNTFMKLIYIQDDSNSIAINGKWGSGKTVFIKQCQYIINKIEQNSQDDIIQKYLNNLNSFLKQKKKAEQEEKQMEINQQRKAVQKVNEQKRQKEEETKIQKIRAVYYDAWKYDNEVDPVVSLFSVLNDELEIQSIDNGELVGKIINFFSLLAPIFFPRLANSIESIGKYFENNSKDKNITFDELLRQIIRKKSLDRLVIFVDELDRCSPTYAVKLLERIKHYFINTNITFVFGINIEELQFTIESYYGKGFNSYEYLDRFFNLIIQLPDPDINSYLKFIDNKYRILKISYLFNSLNGEDSVFYDTCNRVVKNFHFSMRQINHFYQDTNKIVYSLLNVGSHNDDQLPIVIFILPIMIAFKLTSLSEYEKFINMKSEQKLIDILDIDNNSCIDKFTLFNESKHDVISRLYKEAFSDSFTYKKLLLNAMSLLSNENNYLI